MKNNPLFTALSALIIAALPLSARAIPAPLIALSPETSLNTTANALETREYHLHDARLPGPFSAHQDVTAWQVTQGSWNGQSLDGLCLVLVHSTSDDGRSPPQTNAYISDFATSAQRQALLTAFLATNPQALCSRDALRLEPAVINLQLDGQSLILHLGLIT